MVLCGASRRRFSGQGPFDCFEWIDGVESLQQYRTATTALEAACADVPVAFQEATGEQQVCVSRAWA